MALVGTGTLDWHHSLPTLSGVPGKNYGRTSAILELRSGRSLFLLPSGRHFWFGKGFMGGSHDGGNLLLEYGHRQVWITGIATWSVVLGKSVEPGDDNTEDPASSILGLGKGNEEGTALKLLAIQPLGLESGF